MEYILAHSPFVSHHTLSDPTYHPSSNLSDHRHPVAFVAAISGGVGSV